MSSSSFLKQVDVILLTAVTEDADFVSVCDDEVVVVRATPVAWYVGRGGTYK